MIDTLGSFVSELRAVGLPVSTAEALDAAAALRHVDLSQEPSVREALAATLVKVPRHRRAFDTAFDVFFGVGAEVPVPGDVPGEATELRDRLVTALRGGDQAALRLAVGNAVSDLAGFQSGRPVGGRYYLYRVLQRLDGIEDDLATENPQDPLNARLAAEEVAALMDQLRDELRREIIRRLVVDRGAEPVARTLRETLVEDLDLMHATSDELARIEAAVAPLAKKLASRMAHRKKLGPSGRLDLRRTIRASLAHGGALIEPKFKPPRRTKPEIVLLCDVSGSMATFARFTLQLTYAVSAQFASVRTFAFIDGVDEVTSFFGPERPFVESLAKLSREAKLVKRDGHSDYGGVFAEFVERYPNVVTPRTSLIVTGDARNNYRDTAADLFSDLASQARSVFWLNPEARRFWDTGDSVMSRYTSSCDAVFEVRTLRQLERFVGAVSLASNRRIETLN